MHIIKLNLLLFWIIAFCNNPAFAQQARDSSETELAFHIARRRNPCPVERKVKNDLQLEGLKGSVKITVTEGYEDNSFKGIYPSKLQAIKTCWYDTTGTLTEAKTEYLKPNYKLSQKRKFDGEHKLLNETFDCSDNSYHKESKYFYDAHGRLTAIQSQGHTPNKGPDAKDGKLNFDLTSTYDTLGNPIEVQEYYTKTSYKYDADGKCIRLVIDNTFGQTSDTISYSYGDNCKVNQIVRTGSNAGKSTYLYDDKDSLMIEKNESVKEILSAGYGNPNAVSYRHVLTTVGYKYDTNGNRIVEERVSNFKDKTRTLDYQYLYDDHGNWTQKDDYEDKKQKRYSIRKITYY